MKIKTVVLFFMIYSIIVTYGQSRILIDSFDQTTSDNTYLTSMEGPSSYMNLFQNTNDKVEGASSLQINAKVGAYHPWGSYTLLMKRVPEGQPLIDWSSSDSLSLWIKVLNPPKNTGYMYFRIHIDDRPTPSDPIEEYIFEDSTIIDNSRGWVNLRVALKERFQDGLTVPNDSGFILAPNSWGGFSYNNRKLDFDKIIGYTFAVVTSGFDTTNIPADSLTFLIDKFERFGDKSNTSNIFNGISLSESLIPETWGNSSLETIEGAGTPNALKWTFGDQWGNGWTGVVLQVVPPLNLGDFWQRDNLNFKLKCVPGTGDLRMQFESPNGKDGIIFSF